jgi:hypothetical protein
VINSRSQHIFTRHQPSLISSLNNNKNKYNKKEVIMTIVYEQ